MNIKKIIKQTVKQGLQYFAAKYGPHTQKSKEDQLLILMYHRILPSDDPRSIIEEPGMLVTPETFQQNLSILSEYFTFINLSEWVERKNNNLNLPKKACAITFDDGWSDNYEFAFPIIKEMSIPITIFLVSNMAGSQEMFWPERLALITRHIALNNPEFWLRSEMQWLHEAKTDYKFSNIPPNPEQITQLISHAKKYTDIKVNDLLDKIESNTGFKIQSHKTSLLNWEQIKEMTDSGLVEIGSHTCNHIRLNNQTPSNILTSEITNSKLQIEKNINFHANAFCFPNGDYSPEALKLVKQFYKSAVTTKSGWNNSSSNNHLLRRIGIHEDIAKNKISFLARISGWL